MDFELWLPNVEYTNVGYQIEYQTCIFELLHPHTSQWGWEPTQTPALWKMIEKSENYGKGYQRDNQFIKEKVVVKDPTLPFVWEKYNGVVPKNAYGISNRKDNTYYIARAYYDGGLHVGYLDPERHVCIISNNGNEIVISDNFEILIVRNKENLYWIFCKNVPIINEGIPIIGGYDKNGIDQFVAKGIYDDIHYFGKVSKQMDGMHFGADEEEVVEKCYQVLVYNREIVKS